MNRSRALIEPLKKRFLKSGIPGPTRQSFTPAFTITRRDQSTAAQTTARMMGAARLRIA
jgi:hypothetical protein